MQTDEWLLLVDVTRSCIHGDYQLLISVTSQTLLVTSLCDDRTIHSWTTSGYPIQQRGTQALQD